jgi:hypothetical protein
MDGDDDHVSEEVKELIWMNGSIPVGQRDDFVFSAQAPADESTLVWKAYQTYADGTVVAWDVASDADQPKKADGSCAFGSCDWHAIYAQSINICRSR